MINLDNIKKFLLLYFSKQFIYFLIAGGLSAFLNFSIRLILRPYFDIIISATFSYMTALVCAFFLYRKFVFPFSSSPIYTQGKRFLLIQIACMPIVILIFSLLAGFFISIGMGIYSEPIAHAISIGTPALITFLLYKLFVFMN
tara:strand:+ start:120 stop:548 length:429 start_codon:yes stop_codon:yes gene_type:complete